ncbi:MAG: hypothetical protein AAF267_25460 [Deinococcota bacterium]
MGTGYYGYGLNVRKSNLVRDVVLASLTLITIGSFALESSRTAEAIERRKPAFVYVGTRADDGVVEYIPLNDDEHPNGWCPQDVVEYEIDFRIQRTTWLHGQVGFFIHARDGLRLANLTLERIEYVQVVAGTYGDKFYSFTLPSISNDLAGDEIAFIYGAFYNSANGIHTYRVPIELSPNCW